MMRAISLWQPWASLMANGSKKDETRNGLTKVRGEVAICASLKWTMQLKNLACSEPFLSALARSTPEEMKGSEWSAAGDIITNTPLGCVVAVGELYDSIHTEEWMRRYIFDATETTNAEKERERRFGNYSPGRGVWRFRNMRKLATPVLCKGAQQWFFLPPAVEAAVRAQLP